MKIKKASATGGLLAGIMILALGTAHAAPTYCSDGGATPDILSEGDVTFRGNDSDDCWGVASIPPADFLSVLNTTYNLWDGGWEASVKDEGAAGTLVNYLGLNWTLSAPNDTSSGNWTLTITDPPPNSLPVIVDIAVVLSGGSNWAAYLFTAQLFALEGLNTGTFAIQFAAGASSQIPDLGHMTLYFRQAGDDITVPEPGVLALLGLGLLSVGVRLRRKA